jgi:hypothetical protein
MTNQCPSIWIGLGPAQGAFLWPEKNLLTSFLRMHKINTQSRTASQWNFM